MSSRIHKLFLFRRVITDPPIPDPSTKDKGTKGPVFVFTEPVTPSSNLRLLRSYVQPIEKGTREGMRNNLHFTLGKIERLSKGRQYVHNNSTINVRRVRISLFSLVIKDLHATICKNWIVDGGLRPTQPIHPPHPHPRCPLDRGNQEPITTDIYCSTIYITVF